MPEAFDAILCNSAFQWFTDGERALRNCFAALRPGGRAVFHGGITIHAGADGSDAALSNKNLLLSDNAEIDTQPVDWSQLEVRLDERVSNINDLMRLGVRVGDTVSFDTRTEFGPNGFITSRYLDDKAGVASVLAAAEAVLRHGEPLPLDVLLLFTISEEVGVGASHVLHGGDVSELISVDNGTIAEGQNTSEYGVTISMMDSSGPFDWHLTRHLLQLCRNHAIEHARDVFRYYRSDAASAVEAGNDIRTALLCFACDASHGYERTHEDSLSALGRLLAAYMLSPPLFQRDVKALGPLGDFPPADCQLTPD